MKITKKQYWSVFGLRFVGYFFILSAIGGGLLTLAPVIFAEVGFRFDEASGRQFAVEEDVAKKTPPVAAPNKFLPPLVGISPINREFSIVIPKIKANASILANIDPSNQTEYTKALKQGVIAHARGTTLPGVNGNSFLFAHSSVNFWEAGQINPVFYLLRELEAGDEIDVFYNNKRYLYLVTDKKIVEPNEVAYLNDQTSDYPKLTLQTCWPPGTALKRLLVIAKLEQAE